MGDRTGTLLQLVAASKRAGEPPLGRVTLVKLVYLCELLRPSYEFWTRSFEFIRYHYGPYSKDVLCRVDFLVFHGLVEVRQYYRQSGAVHATYQATSKGVELAARAAGESRGGRNLAALAEDTVWALQSMGIRTAKEICELVYAEPHFEEVLESAGADAVPVGGSALNLLSSQDPRHPSFRLLAFIQQHPAFQKAKSPRLLVRAYFEYLRTRSLALLREGSAM